jgi:hypothetical protein
MTSAPRLCREPVCFLRFKLYSQPPKSSFQTACLQSRHSKGLTGILAFWGLRRLSRFIFGAKENSPSAAKAVFYSASLVARLKPGPFKVLNSGRVSKPSNEKGRLWAALLLFTLYFHSTKLDPFTTPSRRNFLANGMRELQSIFRQGY